MKFTFGVVSASLVLALAAMFAAGSANVRAGSNIIVETTDDEVAVDGQCSLRQAITAATFDTDGGGDCETGSGADVIEVPDGLYVLDTTLELTTDVTLQGESTAGTILDGQGEFGVLEIYNLTTATTTNIFDMTIRNGDQIADASPFNGGGIDVSDHVVAPVGVQTVVIERVLFTGNRGIAGGALLVSEGTDVTVRHSEFTGNTGTAQGHAAFVSGKLTVEDSRMSENGDPNDGGNGGAITTTEPGELTVIRTEIVNNIFGIDQDFPGYGGAINHGGTTMTLSNVTMSGNRAQEGGAIYVHSDATANLVHVTIANNEAVDSGQALAGTGTVNVVSSIITSDEPADNCANTVASSLASIDSGETCGADMPGTDPLLEPLTQVSGLTRVHTLAEDSPAVDSADGSECPGDDQSGASRPQGNACDIGAYESPHSAATPGPTATPEQSGTVTATPAPSDTPSPTETSPPSELLVWGDDNCSGTPNPIDSLLTLRHNAGLSAETGDCPEMGQVVEVALASPHPWGDVDCSAVVDAVDSLKKLRFDAGLPVPQDEGCPDVGEPVTVTE